MLKKYRSPELWLSLTIAALPIILNIINIVLSDDLVFRKVLPSVIESVFDTPRLLITILSFALATLFLHVAFGYLAWRIWTPFATAMKLSKSERLLLAGVFFLTLQGGLISINYLLFPESALAIAQPVFFSFLGCFLVFSLFVWHIGRAFQARTLSQKPQLGYLVLLFSPFIVGSFFIDSETNNPPQTQRDQPDIIIIGLDSFRPDHLGQPDDPVTITPNLDAFLADAYLFENTYTPMARTYPAWMSIFTGRYPIEHGARFNLLEPKTLIKPKLSLPFILRDKGYVTAYSIDESRFSNIDTRYGFDISLTPKIGAADFLLGSFADIPLNNVLNFTPQIYSRLFPYQYMNRAISKIYEPDSFDAELKQLVATVDAERPLFLVTHYELPHWPFGWRGSTEYSVPESQRLAELSPLGYQKAVNRADTQFAELLEVLKRNGRLENAIVVVLSDHGEGFFNFATKWQAAKDSPRLGLPPFALHGVNVLDNAQTNVLLAFKRFSNNTTQSLQGSSKQLASLVDVAPTLLQLAGLDENELTVSGCDLFASTETGDANCLNDRVVFTESGFYVPKLFESGTIDENKVAAEAYSYYNVGIDTRLTIKSELVNELLEAKQRAAISDGWIVASLPQEKMLIGEMENNTYWGMKGESKKIQFTQTNLFQKLCRHYKHDNASLDSFCTSSLSQMSESSYAKAHSPAS